MQGDVLMSVYAPATSINRKDACLCAIVLEGHFSIRVLRSIPLSLLVYT